MNLPYGFQPEDSVPDSVPEWISGESGWDNFRRLFPTIPEDSIDQLDKELKDAEAFVRTFLREQLVLEGAEELRLPREAVFAFTYRAQADTLARAAKDGDLNTLLDFAARTSVLIMNLTERMRQDNRKER